MDKATIKFLILTLIGFFSRGAEWVMTNWEMLDVISTFLLRILSAVSFVLAITLYIRKIFKGGKELPILVLAILLMGCSPEYKLRRLVDRYSSLKTKDTILVHDTVIVQEVQFDTLVENPGFGDTLFLERERLTIKYVNLTDSIYLEGECKEDTIFQEIEIQVEKFKYVNKDTYRWPFFLVLVIALLFVVTALYNIFKSRHPN